MSPEASRIGIIAPLRTELAPFLGGRAFVRRNLPGLDAWEDDRFIVVRSGMGILRTNGAAFSLAMSVKLKLLVSAGFCGAGVDDLKTGDVIVDGDATIEGARRGKILTAERVLRGEEIKRACAEAGAIAADMESGAVRTIASSMLIPFAAVRVVLDTPSEPLAADYSSIAGVVLRPWLWPGVARDANRAKIAAQALAQALDRLA